jgi:hypothetical protein
VEFMDGMFRNACLNRSLTHDKTREKLLLLLASKKIHLNMNFMLFVSGEGRLLLCSSLSNLSVINKSCHPNLPFIGFPSPFNANKALLSLIKYSQSSNEIKQISRRNFLTSQGVEAGK